MPQIRQLSATVVNKIAAGEVIERPASVVKELLENAVDAGSSRIDLTVEKGGGQLIRVADNGCGIPAAQLPLAAASHATSKISTAEDLFSVGTLGFRGEALASIGSVSRLLIRSRPPEEAAGAELEVIGGALRGPHPCGSSPGTVVEVRQLFFNTPVRQKFLRTTQTEMGHVSEAFTRLALAYPGLHFTLRHGERTLHDLPPSEAWTSRLARFFGQELAEDLIPIENQFAGVRLSGYVAHPRHSRSHNRMQYLFLNGRWIRDRALQHALGEAYRGLLMTGRMPICFLRLEVPAEAIDVNVHPTKREVRFQDSGQIYRQILSTIRTRFLTADLNDRLQPHSAGSPEAEPMQQVAADLQMRQELVEWTKQQLPPQQASSGGPDRQHEFALPAEPRSGGPLVLHRIDAPAARAGPPPGAGIGTAGESVHAAGETAGSASHPDFDASGSAGRASFRGRALQVHNRYLITESDEGMVVIDQHALHERILYEQLREAVLNSHLESQRLLVPEPVDLTGNEAAAALEHRELLARLGLEVEHFGGDTVLVLSYPAMLANLRPAELLRELVEQLLADGKQPDRRDILDSLLHMISCKAAIKAGDRLAPEEIDELLELRHLAQDAHHCPHGRPTSLVFTRDELDRQFKRG